jgi:hypothetical protein
MDSTPDPDRQVLIRLREDIAATRPTGIRARLRRWWELRQADGYLDLEEAYREGVDPIAEPRHRAVSLIVTVFGLNAVFALLRSGHAVTLGRVAWVLSSSALVVAGALAALPWLYRKHARSTEREYARWLERARALSTREEAKALGSSELPSN